MITIRCFLVQLLIFSYIYSLNVTNIYNMEPDLEKIVEQYGTMISSISHRMIQNKEVAKEAAQEVWYEIIRSIGSFNGQSELSTWIYTICKRSR